MLYETLLDVIEHQAAELADQLLYRFLVDGETREVTLTYAELFRRAGATAAHIQEHTQPDDRVLILMPPGLDYVVGFFGCVLAGSIAVPAYPPDPARLARSLPRLQALVRDAQPRVVLTTSPLAMMATQMKPMAGELASLRWLTCDDIPDARIHDWQRLERRPDDIAFLQYSSGSTGEPKGVMLSHGNLLANSRAIAATFRHGRALRGMIWLPPYHDMGLIGGILQPMYVGGEVTLMSPLSFLSRPVRWLQAISRYRATTSGGPNFAFDLCMRKVRPEERDALDLSSWQVAFNGAEPIRGDTLRRFADYFAPCGFRREAFLPCYGLAESTLIVTGGFDAADADQASTDASAPYDCGPPVADTEVAIVGPESLRTAAPGEVGEIWVRSPSVGRGYWNKATLSEATFRARLHDGAGPYMRTGDLGYLHGGHLFVTGRIKDLLIIRGRNVYPQDLEQTAVTSSPGLRPGCTAAFMVTHGGEEVVAIAQEVDSRALPIDVEAVAAAMREAVALQHDVQVAIVLLLQSGTIPKTSSGKIQRYACRQQFLDGSLELVGSSIIDSAPVETAASTPADELTPESLWLLPVAEQRSRLESWLLRRIAGFVRLPAAAIDPAAPLAQYGLDSLGAAEIAGMIHDELGVAVSMTRVLSGSTLGSLVRAILEAGPAGELPASAPADHTGPMPLSHGQQALWYFHQFAPHSPVYNVAAAARIRQALDMSALERAFARLAERHPALRTVFVVSEGGQIRQVTSAESMPRFERVDASGWDEPALEEAVSRAARAPFALTTAPLVRITLYQRAADDAVLLFCAPHAIIDLWSLTVMARELGALYDQVELPAAVHDHGAFVRWQAQWLASPEGQQALAYWKEALAGELPVLRLPEDRPRPASQTFRGALCRFELGRPLSERLHALAREHGVTTYTTLLTAFQVLVARLAGQDEVIVGSPVHGRVRPEFRNIVGYLVNTVPTRADLRDNPSFTALLRRVHEQVQGALVHQSVPLSLLVERLGGRRDVSRSPLFSAMFVLEAAPYLPELGEFALGLRDARLALGSLVLEGFPVDLGTAELELTARLVDTAAGIRGCFHYNADMFSEASVRTWVRCFEVLLDAVAREPGRPVIELPLLTRDEQAALVAGDAGPARSTPIVPVHARIHTWAETAPARPAVVCEGSTLTYAELDRWSGTVATHLRSAGVARGTRVGLVLGSGVEWVVGMLGIFRAGGTLVLLPGDVPPTQLSREVMARDAGVTVILTDVHHEPSTPSAQMKVVRMTGLDGATSGELAEVAPGDRACVAYTADTPAAPRGVVVTHGALAGQLDAIVERLAPGADERVLFLGAPGSSTAMEQILALLVCGATVVLRSEEVRESAELFRRVREAAITTIMAPTALWHELAMQTAIDFHSIPSLRTMVVHGEALAPDAVARWLALAAAPRLLFAYVLPEAAGTASVLAVTREPGLPAGRIPIGRPLAGKPMLIIDQHNRLCPPGVFGELVIGGSLLALEVHDQSEATRERFVTIPGAAQAGDAAARAFRTGKRARRLADGSIELQVSGHVSQARAGQGAADPPQGEVEQVIAGMWADALAIARPGRNDDFFELGGHSLLATTLSHRLRQTFRCDIPLHQLMEQSTVAGWARVVCAHEPSPGRARAIARMLQRIQGMSPDEVQKTLQRLKTPKNAP